MHVKFLLLLLTTLRILLIFIFVVSLSALFLSNSIKAKPKKQEESSESLHSQILELYLLLTQEFLDINYNCLLTSIALVQIANVSAILPVHHLFSPHLAIQHLHLQSARTQPRIKVLLIFTMPKKALVFDTFVYMYAIFA